MPYVLRNLVIDRVDLVDRGANPKARVLIVKRDLTNTSKREEPSMATTVSKRASAWNELEQMGRALQDRDPSLSLNQAIDKAMRTTRGFEILKAYRDAADDGED